MELKRRVAEIATCSICLENYKSPRILPCLHSFCLECLQGHCLHKRPGDVVPCPVCMDGFRIPQKGLASLKVNLNLESLVDARDVSNTASGSESCEVCRSKAATMYCVDCSQKLCEGCSLPHEKMRTGAHDVRPLTAELSAEQTSLRESYCDKHLDHRYELYCFDCKCNICMKCFAVSHRQHKCEEIEEAAKDIAKSLKTDMEPLSSRITGYRVRLRKVENKKKQFLTDVKKAEQEVRQRGDQLKRKVDCHVNELLQKLEQVKSTGEKEAQTLVESHQLAVTAMESFRVHSSELISKGSSRDITRGGECLRVKAKELLKTYDNSRSAEDYAPKVTFEASNFDQQTTGGSINIVGTLSTGVVTIATCVLLLRWCVLFVLSGISLHYLNYFCYRHSPMCHDKAIVDTLMAIELTGLWLCSRYSVISNNIQTMCIICISFYLNNDMTMLNLNTLFQAIFIYFVFGLFISLCRCLFQWISAKLEEELGKLKQNKLGIRT